MLSIIIPFVAESPQLFFTVQALRHELAGVEHEILLIDNATALTNESTHPELNCSLYIERKRPSGVRLLKFSERQSHWQAKNLGIEESKGDILFFIDAHCLIYPGSLHRMYFDYTYYSLSSRASFHLPLAYLMEDNALAYELVADLDNGILDYRFTPFTPSDPRFASLTPVPCMSTCGMMIRKALMVDKLKSFPEALGPYSGGEQYFNFIMALLGYDKIIINLPPLQHYAAPRSYTVSNLDICRNKLIAAYLIGGASFLAKRAELFKKELTPSAVDRIHFSIPRIESLKNLRSYIETNSKFTIEQFVKFWT